MLFRSIDRLLDMTRTAVNITGDAAIAVVLNEQQIRKEEKEKTAGQS